MSRYIDADAFIKIQKDMCEKYCTDTENYCEHCCIKRDLLDDLDDFADGDNSFVDWKIPTADVVEVVYGEWISDDDGNIICSVCGRNGVGELFCEHCGADMRGKENVRITD